MWFFLGYSFQKLNQNRKMRKFIARSLELLKNSDSITVILEKSEKKFAELSESEKTEQLDKLMEAKEFIGVMKGRSQAMDELE